jgi:uncharacterized protein YydD (DUF2326 family)
MIDTHLRNITELESKIQQTLSDLEEHCRSLPATQQGPIKETIQRLEMALEEGEAFVGDKRKRPRRRALCC